MHSNISFTKLSIKMDLHPTKFLTHRTVPRCYVYLKGFGTPMPKCFFRAGKYKEVSTKVYNHIITVIKIDALCVENGVTASFEKIACCKEILKMVTVKNRAAKKQRVSINPRKMP